MSLKPNAQADGPVVVHWTDGDVQHYDNCWHTTSGMITLTSDYPVRAVSVPRERIERIEYSTYGLNDGAGE
jgi:hypothetical protein